MKNIFNLVLATIILGFSISCNKDDQAIDPILHESTGIDLDDDGEDDFSINYSEVIIESPTSTYGYVAYLSTHQDNEILYNSEAFTILEFQNVMDIETEAKTPYEWRHKPFTGFNLISISNIHESNSWPEEWSVNSEESTDQFIVGLKIVSPSSEQIGWARIEINTYSGIINVTDKGLL